MLCFLNVKLDNSIFLYPPGATANNDSTESKIPSRPRFLSEIPATGRGGGVFERGGRLKEERNKARTRHTHSMNKPTN